MTRVTISDRYRAMCALQAQKLLLFQEAESITEKQREAFQQMTALGRQHKLVLNRLAALETAVARL